MLWQFMNILLFRKISPKIVFLLLLVAFTSCVEQSQKIGYQQALDTAWNALLINTSSQARENWEIADARVVQGRDVVGEFANARFGNCPGPRPPENLAIKHTDEYWYIKGIPTPATPFPMDSPTSETSPPSIPEPLLREAIFLIDIYSGNIVARSYSCVEY